MKIFFILISLLIIPGAFLGFIDSLKSLFFIKQIIYPILIGFFLGIIAYYLLLRRFYRIQNFEHELTHAFVAILFFRKIEKFVSTSEGGYISHNGRFGGEFGNILISLGPYFLPTFAFLMALARPFVPKTWFPLYDGGTGFMLAYHTASTIDEIVRNYSCRRFMRAGTNKWTITDINRTGFITATIGIISLTLLVHGIIFYLHVGGYALVGGYFKLIYLGAINYSIIVYDWLVTFIGWIRTVMSTITILIALH